ncbi:MAG TPA: PhoH family protein [Polyangiaceae bacterium]|nr:PhoH family protein [Polyangiaceae bacterium]
MRKLFILDTNVLLHDPQAIFKFEDNDLIVPIYVIEEIDRFKRDSSERGRNAREVARLIDSLRDQNGESLAEGVAVGAGGSLRVYVPERRAQLASALNPTSGDNAILQVATELKNAHPDRPTVFVTMDINLRIRADALGLKTANYQNQSVQLDTLKPGVIEIIHPDLDAFFQTGEITVEDGRLYPNVCVMLRSADDEKRTGLGRYGADGKIRRVSVPAEGIMGLRPRNREQTFALDLLLDDAVRLVTLVGVAGTGKTLLALAAGLKRCVQHGAYTRLLVSRPIIPLGRDLGFLPGDVDEKLAPWMKPIFDNLEFLLISGGKRRGLPELDEMMTSGIIEVEPLTYIRGRSLPQQYVIVDEAQNLTPHEVKTIVTRCGEGTKIVLTGDPFQIDNPYVDAATNGLTYAANRMHAEALVGHIVLTKGERSALANLAAAKL